jgi:tRNA threonylcarbamoyladenosine biosynthesis protein TsaE
MVAWKLIAETSDEMKRLARCLGEVLQAGDCVALYGGLGIGKTTFTQGLAQGLGITKPVNSPTFTLVKEYQGRLPLYHMDLYRLEDPTEELGLEEYWDGDGVVVIEWPEIIRQWLPEDRLDVSMARAQGERRVVSIEATGPRSRRRVSDWMAALGRRDTGSEES